MQWKKQIIFIIHRWSVYIEYLKESGEKMTKSIGKFKKFSGYLENIKIMYVYIIAESI